MRYDVLVVGRPTADLVFTDVPRWPRPGREVFAGSMLLTAGGAFNVTAALHKLGLRVGLVGVVGNDHWSQTILSSMEEQGVGAELMQLLDRPVPNLSVAINHEEDRGFLTYDAWDDELGRRFHAHVLEVLRREDARYVQSYLTPEIVDYRKVLKGRNATLLVDTSWHEEWLRSERLRDLLTLPDVVFTSRPELCEIAGTDDVDRALDRLSQYNDFIVVKCGSEGSTALACGRRYTAESRPVKVVDATGAGDCFNAGFLYGLSRGLDVQSCLVLGNICGRFAVQAPGGFQGSPTEEQLRRVMSNE